MSQLLVLLVTVLFIAQVANTYLFTKKNWLCTDFLTSNLAILSIEEGDVLPPRPWDQALFRQLEEEQGQGGQAQG